jgi:hypothetical protein
MPKPLETSAKLRDVSVSQEIRSIGHLDKQSQSDLQVRCTRRVKCSPAEIACQIGWSIAALHGRAP